MTTFSVSGDRRVYRFDGQLRPSQQTSLYRPCVRVQQQLDSFGHPYGVIRLGILLEFVFGHFAGTRQIAEKLTHCAACFDRFFGQLLFVFHELTITQALRFVKGKMQAGAGESVS